MVSETATTLRLLMTGLWCGSWAAPPPPGWERLPPATCRRLQPFFPELNLRRDVLWRVGPLPWWVRRTALVPPVAVTFGSLVWVAPGWYAPETPAGVELIAHELTHVVQYRRHGYVGFTLRYGWSFLTNLLRGAGFAEAYENIPFEVEARTRAAAVCRHRPWV